MYKLYGQKSVLTFLLGKNSAGSTPHHTMISFNVTAHPHGFNDPFSLALSHGAFQVLYLGPLALSHGSVIVSFTLRPISWKAHLSIWSVQQAMHSTSQPNLYRSAHSIIHPTPWAGLFLESSHSMGRVSPRTGSAHELGHLTKRVAPWGGSTSNWCTMNF